MIRQYTETECAGLFVAGSGPIRVRYFGDRDTRIPETDRARSNSAFTRRNAPTTREDIVWNFVNIGHLHLKFDTLGY